MPHSICKLRCCQKLKAKNPAHSKQHTCSLWGWRGGGRRLRENYISLQFLTIAFLPFIIWARMFAAHPSVHSQPSHAAPVRLQLPRKVLVPLLCPTHSKTRTHTCVNWKSVKIIYKYTHMCVRIHIVYTVKSNVQTTRKWTTKYVKLEQQTKWKKKTKNKKKARIKNYDLWLSHVFVCVWVLPPLGLKGVGVWVAEGFMGGGVECCCCFAGCEVQLCWQALKAFAFWLLLWSVSVCVCVC